MQPRNVETFALPPTDAASAFAAALDARARQAWSFLSGCHATLSESGIALTFTASTDPRPMAERNEAAIAAFNRWLSGDDEAGAADELRSMGIVAQRVEAFHRRDQMNYSAPRVKKAMRDDEGRASWVPKHSRHHQG